MDPTVTVAVVNGSFLVVGGVLAGQNVQIKKHAKANGALAVETKEEVAKIERRTNGELDEKIKNAVRAVFAEQHGTIDQVIVIEALANLLEAMVDEKKED